MSFAKKILSRFFGLAEGDAETQDKAQLAPTPGLQVEEQADAESMEVSPPSDPDPTHITLPEDHALYQLWHMYAEQVIDASGIQLELMPSTQNFHSLWMRLRGKLPLFGRCLTALHKSVRGWSLWLQEQKLFLIWIPKSMCTYPKIKW